MIVGEDSLLSNWFFLCVCVDFLGNIFEVNFLKVLKFSQICYCLQSAVDEYSPPTTAEAVNRTLHLPWA